MFNEVSFRSTGKQIAEQPAALMSSGITFALVRHEQEEEEEEEEGACPNRQYCSAPTHCHMPGDGAFI